MSKQFQFTRWKERKKGKDNSYQQLKTKLFLVSVITMFLSIVGIYALYDFVFLDGLQTLR